MPSRTPGRRRDVYVNDLVPDLMYSVVANLCDREVTLLSGERLILDWERLKKVQKFLWSPREPEGYILVRESQIKTKETLRQFTHVVDASPIVTCLLTL